MLTRDGCLARQERLWSRLHPKPDWLIVSDPRHLTYLANFYLDPATLAGQGAGFLILYPDGRSMLVTDNFLRHEAARACVDHVELAVWYNHRDSVSDRATLLIETAHKLLRDGPATALGLEPTTTPALLAEKLNGRYPSAQVVPLTEALHQLRVCKDPDEVDLRSE